MQFTSGENTPQWGKTMRFCGFNIGPPFQQFCQVPSDTEKAEQMKTKWSIQHERSWVASVASHLGWQVPSHAADNLFPAKATQDRNGIFSHLDF